MNALFVVPPRRRRSSRIAPAAAFFTLCLVPVAGTALLTGCGSDSGEIPLVRPMPGPSRFVGAFRSQFTLSDGRTGVLELTTRESGGATGNLTVRDASGAVAGTASLSGSVNVSTGAVDISGALTQGGQSGNARYRATLPGGTAPSGGPASGTGTLQFGGASFSASVTSGTGGSPSPGASPTAPPSASPTVSPSPSPSASPGGGDPGDLSGSLFREFADGDTFTYTQTTTVRTDGAVTFGPETKDVVTTGDLFGEGRIGAETTVNLDGVAVRRRESLDDAGKLVAYLYYTRDSNLYRVYGNDVVGDDGQVILQQRYSPALEFQLRPEKGRT